MDDLQRSERQNKGDSIPLSIVLQSPAASWQRTLFLFPDGSGSGMVYASLPILSGQARLIALNSPFIYAAKGYTDTVEAMAQMWEGEVRKRQPHGPYTLGGWSAGGFYAYEMAKLLTAKGERVEKLVLIDSPCRLTYEPLPMRTMEALAERGVIGSTIGRARTAPKWVVNHFRATIEALERYAPVALREGADGCSPTLFLIWASDGVKGLSCGGVDADANINRLLLETRTEFGPSGWERLVPPGAEIKTAAMSGSHFSMVHPPHVSTLDH